MTMYLSIIVCVIGGLLYLILPTATNPRPVETRIAELARISFFAGLLSLLLQAGPQTVPFLR